MLELKDFFHLPQVDSLIDQLVADRPGLLLVAGMDSRPADRVPAGMLPGGVSTFFGILARRLVTEHPSGKAILIGERPDVIRMPAKLQPRIRFLEAAPSQTFAERMAHVARLRPELIIIDQLRAETAAAVLRCAQEGIRILSRIDCIFCGSGVARHLVELGVARDLFDGLRWIVTVQRIPTLCPVCRTRVDDDVRIPALVQRYPNLPPERSFSNSPGCTKCSQTGRQGDVTAFDLFRAAASQDAPPGSSSLFEQSSLLSMEEYAAHLAALGHVSIDDVAQINTEQTHRTFLLLASSERALEDANTELKAKLVELETARRVMERRNESLIALEEIGHSLIASTELVDLAQRICRSTQKLCGADRSILYVMQANGQLEVVAVNGWETNVIHARLDAAGVLGNRDASGRVDDEPTTFRGFPPGIPARHDDVEGATLRAGLRVPLVAQGEIVGMMIVHSTRKARFEAGDIAMLKTLASQAATAIQRADLFRSLQDKIVQLEAAQAELIKKERLERELELAREVQQRLLPRVFPVIEGYAFAARSDAARRVGGDFYDVFRVDDDHFGIVIADVSDKGMPAALFMALTRSLLFAEARREISPMGVLTHVHKLLLELGEPDMFVTVFYGVVDLRSRTLTYCRAGHEEPLLLRGQTVEPLRGKGTLLGSLDLSQLFLSEEHVQLQHGDRLVLYTDGLTDAVDARERPFGLDRLKTLLQENGEAAPDELVRRVFAGLASYQAQTEQFDDMAILVMDAGG